MDGEWMASFVFLLFVANCSSIHMCEYGEDNRAYNVFNICLLLLSLPCVHMIRQKQQRSTIFFFFSLFSCRRCHLRVWVWVWVWMCVTIWRVNGKEICLQLANSNDNNNNNKRRKQTKATPPQITTSRRSHKEEEKKKYTSLSLLSLVKNKKCVCSLSHSLLSLSTYFSLYKCLVSVLSCILNGFAFGMQTICFFSDREEKRERERRE